jgi:hypothetical protein
MFVTDTSCDCERLVVVIRGAEDDLENRVILAGERCQVLVELVIDALQRLQDADGREGVAGRHAP